MERSGNRADGRAGHKGRTVQMLERISAGLKWALLTIMLVGVPLDAAWSRSKKPSLGETLAIKHCALCHVVGTFNKFGGIGSTPSFQSLASMKDGEERFVTFFVRRPHLSFVFLPGQAPPTGLPIPVPSVRLSDGDTRAIADFAMSLKDPRPGN